MFYVWFAPLSKLVTLIFSNEVSDQVETILTNSRQRIFQFRLKHYKSYLHAVAGVASFHQQAADNLTNDQVQAYLLHCIREKMVRLTGRDILRCPHCLQWNQRRENQPKATDKTGQK
jgi:hypothetical protein